jgi:hypothetical protein
MSLLVVIAMLALVWFGNRHLKGKVDLDPADPHVLRAGSARLRLDWATGTMTDHSLRKENVTSFIGAMPSPRADGVSLPQTSGGAQFSSGVRFEESFALVEAGGRNEFSFTKALLDDWVGHRLTLVWITHDDQRYYVRFHNWNQSFARTAPYPYWKLIEGVTREAEWTAVPAVVVGWIVAGWLGLWGLLGGFVAFVVWYIGCGLLRPKQRDFERDYLEPLIAKVGAAGA